MRSSGLSGLPAWAARMLEEAPVGYLGFLDDRDRPRVLPVTFAVSRDALWTAVDHKPKRRAPARLRYLRRRPQACLTVDRYEDDWSGLAWVQILGAVEVIETATAPGALEPLIGKYPPYRDRRPAGPLLRLAPDRVVHWRAADF